MEMMSKKQKEMGKTMRSQQMMQMADEMRGEGGGLFGTVKSGLRLAGDVKKGVGSIKQTLTQFVKEQKKKIGIGGGLSKETRIGIVRKRDSDIFGIPSPFRGLGGGFQGNFSGPVVGNKPNLKPLSGNYSVAGHGTQLFEEEAGKDHFHMMNAPRHRDTPSPNTTPSWRRIRTPQQIKLLGKKPRVMAAPKNLFGRGTINTDTFGPLDQ